MDIIFIEKAELSDLIQKTLRTVLSEQSPVLHPDKNQSQFLSMEEAAAFLKIPKSSLYQLTSKREIQFVKRSRRIFFKISDLEKWQEAGRMKSKTELFDEGLTEIKNRFRNQKKELWNE